MAYQWFAGGPALGWSRRVGTSNMAGVREAITRAEARGDAVVLEDKGIIRVDNAARLDPGFPESGQPSPAWYVPMNNVSRS
jgi:hypothetical protein